MDKYRYRHERNNPSFSSTLLDAIYRSIDGEEEEFVLYRETMRKKQTSFSVNGGFEEDRLAAESLRRACEIEKWMEKRVSEKVVVRRKSVADFDRISLCDRDAMLLNSSSTSSDSSSGGGFSSSEAESVYGASSRYAMQRPKPIRTSFPVQPERKNYVSEQKPKHEGGFVKTKSKALKIYGDLKKVKQPISPGGKLANFLNSLFAGAGNAKKSKVMSSAGGYVGDKSSERISKSANSSTCSSASSFSRSCLSKTPSSRGKLSSNGTKRSVRFYPISVIVDEDCQPCGHKSLNQDQPISEDAKSFRNSINEELKFHITEKNRRVEEAARELLKNYQKKVEREFDLGNMCSKMNREEDDDDDDAASYDSSDLFELDNLEELPVYETTHFDTNQAIANGLIL